MKKKMISLVLAALLVCAMAVPASAAQYTYMDAYETAFYEVIDNLYLDHFSSTTQCSESRLVYSNVHIQEIGQVNRWYYGIAKPVASDTSAYTINEIVSMTCYHYVDGDPVHQCRMVNSVLLNSITEME